MGRRAVCIVGALLAAPGCNPGGEHVEPEEPTIVVLVSQDGVEVHAQAPTGCREATSVPDADSCETFGWAVLGVDNAVTTDLCRPEPTCVFRIRLESDGEVVAEAQAQSVAFAMDVGSEAQLVVEGCGDPLVIPLPDPLDSEGDIETELTDQGLLVTSNESSGETFARLAGLPSYPREFIAACRSNDSSLLLPTSSDFSIYSAEVYLMGPAEAVEDPRVRVHRTKRIVRAVGPDELGPVWEAAAAAARLSPHYDACSAFCEDYAVSCSIEGENDPCVVTCIGSFSVSTGCEDKYQDYLDCSATEGCRDAIVTELAESPSSRSRSALLACQDESDAYAACME